jgi:hypothetical protein
LFAPLDLGPGFQHSIQGQCTVLLGGPFNGLVNQVIELSIGQIIECLWHCKPSGKCNGETLLCLVSNVLACLPTDRMAFQGQRVFQA